ncbi:nucleotide pyrophosphatase [Haloferax mediterranei ATCC 33500]|uniref:Nucleotide pyrophosphatase n=1 Tax=Haloferax mediterranei (strain ATCC 33500 / DSM 1411 / JCM 8866 / NBRC 14739 / NCIMB 2177 / R-4) TaxID=523841 RepID=I3R2G5_HALMT|nr:alkaline phosphatase family protein [Haloferax mediterranei]AFK18425.2 sulfatase arylsulfatase A-like protein [Haloferax mediterranei ATCC 33500]EMA02299.1 sulfatase [Haloferax mediterranei ATCC 33500]MDX5988517.1 alkaline phosphatase family protein [Haloferax mediterranei ATCC 33500]QCQ74933.1 nucleotide pyrophosphatase [Haloferax mediterranei ATCC 33500]
MGLFDRLRGKDHPRVAFIGIDGVPFSLLSEYPEEFPNFAALADEGSAGAIDSIVPPESSACWPALTTGVNPGETGVYGFQDREVGSYDAYVPMGRDVQATRVWDRVTDAGRKATVMNVPVTFPPQRNVQRMVSGFLSPGVDKAAYPDDFRDTLSEMGYKIDVNAKLGHDEDKTAFMEDAQKTLDRRYNAFERYLQEDDWDLFFGVFMTTDRVNHFLFKDYERDGKNKDAFFEFYRTVDDYIGRIRDTLSDDVTLVVASDHGFTSLDYEVHCNTWLEENGWLSYETDDHDSLGDIDADSKAYSLIPGRFFINLEGREPRGSVPQEEYEEVRDELKAELEALEGPDGKKVAERVVVKEDAFRGDHDDIAPDLVIIPNHGFDLKSGFRGHDDVFGVGPRNGMHSFDNATLYVDDPNAVIEDADLYDITPTILDLMEVDYARTELDGASLIQQ